MGTKDSHNTRNQSTSHAKEPSAYSVPFGTSFSFPPAAIPAAPAAATSSAFSSSFWISTFCCSMLSLKVACAALGLDIGLDVLSFSRASISDGVKVSVLLGRKGTGVLAREVRNYGYMGQICRVGCGLLMAMAILTELAALSSAIRLACTTSSWMPTPQTLRPGLPLAVHSI